MRSGLVDLTVEIHHSTALAVLVSVDGNRNAAVWLPLSAIELERKRGFTFATITLPENLAISKGLV